MFRYFKEISDVPRSSSHNEKISAYSLILLGARTRILQDESGNVIIWKDGTPGYENSDMVMIQGTWISLQEKTEG